MFDSLKRGYQKVNVGSIATLKDDNTLNSDLWIDQKDANKQLDKLKGKLDQETIDHLDSLINNGYCIVDLQLTDEFINSFLKEVDRLWTERPRNLLVAEGGSKPNTFNSFGKDMKPEPGTRLIDMHAHSDYFTDLYLHHKIHSIIEIIYQENPVATQSLYFEYGSQQSLHRDPWFVVTKPASNLLAVWIALEDIEESSGPLSFVPGSHRLPFKRFKETDDIIFHSPKVEQAERQYAYDLMKSQIEKNNLEVKKFLAKKGQALIWHSALAHGGSPVTEESRTRKSYVVHFDKISGRKTQKQRVYLAGGESKVYSTDILLSKNNCFGFDNPIRTKI